MANIELVIKIPEELYETYKGRPPMLGDAGMDMIAQSIANGTSLPKGHGRLIDLNDLYALDRQRVEYAPTVVEPEFQLTDTQRSFLSKVQNDMSRINKISETKQKYGEKAGE